MLAIWHRNGGGLIPISAAECGSALADAIWIDAANPTPEEAASVEAAAGLHVASIAELEEIETSSRLAERSGLLYLSLPWVTHDAATGVSNTPIGLAVSSEHLLTVHFAPIGVLTSLAERLAREPSAPLTGAHAFITLLETMVDGIADRLERTHADLDLVSRRIFKPDPASRGPARVSEELRTQLRSVGTSGEAISGIRDTLLAFGRLVPFVGRREVSWMPPEFRSRLNTLRQDVISLTDYDTHLTDKVQFLLDAILGFINIEQNNIIKLMTVVGVVGVPPTLIASIYGMNFENMPELHLPHAYPVALLVIFMSAVIPIVWFRRRGWL